ncbi:OLC1v1028346C1 [Oldenlandia corymbosa var. corymbosa]|uniref:2-phytyl-1,4-beta-naphthoquinone methyltransferase, chloroplastic n=1 Tax=Oldenlandia corymbosa var. corymbosa TaxID=529605 RepID=A0AAV1CC84_OLDCO|nr:OLC1v1028346C1 [Oldenlandia corymbosa var. corymbosa]
MAAAAASLKLNLPSTPGGTNSRPIFRSKFRVVRCSTSTDRQELFNRIAPVYDNLNDLFSLGRHREWKNTAVSWSRAKVGDNVLDICCGSGDLAFLLSEKVGPNGKVVGLDFSKEQLSIAAARQQSNSKKCHKIIKWVEGDALDLPFPESYFDAITIGYGLRNVVDRQKSLKEAYRVLKPGSRISVLDFNKSDNPLMTSFQEWTLDNVVVPIASSQGVAEEYRYLKESIRGYLTGKELEYLALEAGFSTAKHFVLDLGLMGHLVATK